LLGHRGARRRAPENSLAAFDLALAHGCDGFEFDVRWTRDQHAVICHDPELAGLPVADSTYAAIVQNLRSAFPEGTSDPEIAPRLQEVVKRYSGRALLDVELKVAGLEEKAIACVEPLATNTYVVSSFLPESLQRLSALRPGIPLGFICDHPQTLLRWRKISCSFVMPELKLISKALIDEMHSADKKVFAWTVNVEADMLRLAEAGVDAIISDDTELLGHVFS
jgi:glycerophosphoryl diester phosphodiesterase